MNFFSAWHRFHAWGCNLLGTSVDPQTRKRVQELLFVDCRRTSRLQRVNNDILFFKVQSLHRQLDVSSWNKSKVECGHLPLLTCQGFRHAELYKGSHVLQCRDIVSHCYRYTLLSTTSPVWGCLKSFNITCTWPCKLYCTTSSRNQHILAHRGLGKVSMVHLGALAVLLSVVLGLQEPKHKIQPSCLFIILIHSQRCCCSAG